MTNKFNRINFWIPIIVVLGFSAAILIENKSANDFYSEQSLIDKRSEINIDVVRTNWKRGVLSFNEEYYFSVGDLNLTQTQIDYLELNCTQILGVYKSAMSDTLKLTYSSRIDTLIFR